MVRIEKLSLAPDIHELRKGGIRNIASAQAAQAHFRSAVETVQQKLLGLEHKNVAEVLRDRADGRRTIITKDGRSEVISPDILVRAKEAAIALYFSK